MPELIPFFIVIIAGLFFSHLFNRLHLPWVVALIVAGIVIGPNGLDIFRPDDTFDLLSNIGLIFLMFIAGLETKASNFGKIKKGVLPIFILNSLIPFVTGLSIGIYFGYDILTSSLLGIILTSASIAVIIPSLESQGKLKTKLGQSIVATAILEDVLSLTLLFILIHVYTDTSSDIPLPLLLMLLFVLLVALKEILPKIQKRFSFALIKRKDSFEHELRLVFVILIGTVIFFEIIGLEPIIAGFFTGMTLSGSINSEILRGKLHTMSYGIFIPIFFVTIGTKTNFAPLIENKVTLIFTIILIVGSLISKFGSGWIGGKLGGFNNKESILIGVSTIPHLSTALAVIFTGHTLEIIDEQLFTAMMTLTLVTTLISPILINKLSPKLK